MLTANVLSLMLTECNHLIHFRFLDVTDQLRVTACSKTSHGRTGQLTLTNPDTTGDAMKC